AGKPAKRPAQATEIFRADKKGRCKPQRPIETSDQGASKSTSVNLAGLKGGGGEPFMPASELRISA
ncbi:hypothetical protein, partial [Pseudomonas putida]|uniref:hypothetical protein n=1 Tax=Pseudomonas putida TaxID=303 RepID=UPI00195558E0